MFDGFHLDLDDVNPRCATPSYAKTVKLCLFDVKTEHD